MADEIIKLIEYIKPFVQSAFIGYMLLVLVVTVIVLAIFIMVLRTIFNNKGR